MQKTVAEVEFRLEDKNKTIEKNTKQAQKLNAELEKTQQLATGTRSGSKAVAASYRKAGAGAEAEDYSRARGSMGATGAAGRDFANQSQGLGGLVRLYATYAANLFAATAAFTALSEAVNTSNMIRGLDQIGAAGGKNLAGLSKQFQEATGFAISTREAIEATAKATSSGLSSEQFIRLGNVARQASQALGVGMSDAVSRLTRGITKLEPELLDELGIFTKVGKATEDYAKSIGKTANSLTDFERRQAFANAVLEEGEKKFSEIKLDTNPYDKFLATLKDVGFEILNIVNVAVKPLVELLGTSPTGMAAAIGLVGVRIVNQALPALLEYRQKLNETTEMAAVKARDKAKEADAALKKFREANKTTFLTQAEKPATVAQQAWEDAEEAALANRYVNKEVKNLIRTKEQANDWTEKELANLDRLGKANTKVSATYRHLATSIRNYQTEEQNFIRIRQEQERLAEAAPGTFTRAAELQREATAARRSSISTRTIGSVNRVYDTQGFGPAVQRLKDVQGRLDKLGTTTKWYTNIQAGSLIAARGISTLASGMMSLISGPLTAFLIAFPILEMLFGKNAEEMAKFNSAIDANKDSVKAAEQTLKKYKDTVTIDSILAQANATQDLNTNLRSLVDSYEEASRAASTFDNIVNAAKGIFGADRASKQAKSLAENITQQLKLIKDPGERKALASEIKRLVGGGGTDAESITTYLGFKSEAEIVSFQNAILNLFKSTDQASQNSVRRLSNVGEGFADIQNKFQALENSLMQKSVIGDFGASLVAQTTNIASAFTNAKDMAAVLNTILEDTSKISAFDLKTQQALISAATQVNELNIQLEAAVDANDRMKEASIRKQIEYIRVNLGDALNKTIDRGFKLIQLESSRILTKASLEASKSIVSILPESEATIKEQLRLDIQMLELKRSELVETRRLTDQIALDRISRERQEEKAKNITDPRDVRGFQESQNRLAALDLEERAIRDHRSLMTKDNTPEERAAAAQRLRLENNLQAQLSAIGLERYVKETEAQARLQKLKISDIQKQVSNEKQLLQEQEKRYMSGAEFLGMSLEDQQQVLEGYRRQQAELDLYNTRLEKSKDITAALSVLVAAQNAKDKEKIPLAQSALDRAIQEYIVASNLKQVAEENRQVAQSRLDIQSRFNKLLEDQRILQETQKLEQQGAAASQLAALEYQERDLQLRTELGQVTERDAQAQRIVLEQQRAQIALEQAQLDISRDRANALSDWTKRFVANNQIMTDSLQTEQDGIIRNSDLRAQQAVDDYNAKLRLLDLDRFSNSEQTKLLKDYSNVFKNSIDGLTDAFVEFAKTGKSSFKDLANSIISDLLRIALRAQLSNVFEGLFGKGWSGTASNWLGKLLGNITAPGMASLGPTGATGTAYDFSGISEYSAKGGAYDYGVRKFAKGGAFTNQIVDSPTLFKFAKGTGLMGEAGPEAIMPLKRDANGNLGVRAGGGGNVEVVVNNYSTAQATTSETTDSRGNRRIEVVVGEMVAGEVSRTGSQTQQAFMNTFGSRPALARR